MSHVPFAPVSSSLKSLLFQAEPYQQRAFMSYYNPPADRPLPFWNVDSKGYELRSGSGCSGRAATPFPGQTGGFREPVAQWSTQQSTSQQKQPLAGANGNRSSSRKRRISAVLANIPIIDITNDTTEPEKQSKPKAKKRNGQANNSSPKQQQQQKKASSVPVPSSGATRIDSIFHHVELLAQSYWHTGNASGVFKTPTGGPLEKTRIRTS